MAHKVVVAGGGYAGLAALAELKQWNDLALVLVDPEPGHTLIPELPEALEPRGKVSNHIVEFTRILAGTDIERRADRVSGIDPETRTLTLASGATERYDWLILAVGTEPAFAPVPGLRERARPLRTARDTEIIKRSLEQKPHQNVVVVGGGLTGVEVAGVLAPDHAVTLVEAAKRLMPGLGPGLAEYARRQLVEAGVAMHLGHPLRAVDDHAVHADGLSVPYDVLIWAGGIGPPEWLRHTALPLDRDGYPRTDGHGFVTARIFAAGDLWRVYDGHEMLPQTAQLAEAAGEYVGQALRRAVDGKSLPPPFRPRLRGMLVSLNPGQGVGWVYYHGLPVRGFSARLLKNATFREHRQRITLKFGKVWPV